MENNLIRAAVSDEMELLEFCVGGENFGINIAKVNEIMTNEPVTPVPNADPAVEGIFIPRDKLITVVDLHKVLGYENTEQRKSIFIVCSFNDTSVAFHVTSVRGFQRVPYNSINKPPMTGKVSVSTGVVKIEDRVIQLLDFEKIVSDLSGGTFYDKNSAVTANESICSMEIVIADDSPFLNELITDMVSSCGFSNISHFKNGAEAWEHIRTADVRNIGCVITDIEMPQTDGIHLTEHIKKLDKNIPVIIFYSLSDEPTRKRCIRSGADAIFNKHETASLMQKVVELTGRRSGHISHK